MSFKVLFVLIVLVSLFQPNIYTQQKKKTIKTVPLEGNWETIPNPLEASLLKLEFKHNKEFKYLLSSTWHGTYKLDGTKLISSLYIPIYRKYKTDTTTVLVYSDTLVQIGKDKGKEITTKMVRKNIGEHSGAGLVGTWVMNDPDAQYATVSYDPSGTFEIKNILKSFSGQYITKSDTLMVITNGQLMLKSRFVIDRGNLRLYSPTKSGPITLEKVKK